MRRNNILGIIFSNMKDNCIREMTEVRTMGSVPFGGRYRLIDFPLSNMMNSGIEKVGVITKSNYRSLMDHVGSGKAWDLSRKQAGLIFLPPYGNGNAVYENRLGALAGIREFIESNKEEYVFLTDCDAICNMDIGAVVDQHIQMAADITVVETRIPAEAVSNDHTVLQTDENGRVTELRLHQKVEKDGKIALSMYVMRRDFLLQIISESVSRSLKDFQSDLLQANLRRFRICAYEFEGYVGLINSMTAYYQANMALLQPEIRKALFKPECPINTKVRDDMPTRYGIGSCVHHSLIADGCIIEGEVENCILFRDVHIGKGVKLSNSIVMQGSRIGDNCDLRYLIVDKDVTIRPFRRLMGFESYPVFISKGSVI